MNSPDHRVKVLHQEAEAFKAFLSGLPPASWEHPSACDRWTVAHVVSHLGTQAFALRVARGLQGDYSPPEGSPPVAEHDEDAFAESIAQRAFDSRERQGDGLLAWFIQSLDESVQAFQGLGPGDWGKLCYWPPGPEPVRTMLDMRISELTMHAWDVRSMLEPDYHLSDDSVAVLIDTVNRAARRAFRPEPDLASPVRYRFNVTTPSSTSVDILIAREGAQVGPGTTDAADVTFTCDGETYVLILYGRLSPDAAITEGRLNFEGDAKVAAEFGARFKGG
jgi:uncharacterized protein (TIGR03083 family)